MAKPKKPKATNAYGEPWLTCPSCKSREVTVTAEQTFMANTGEHWCHSVKTHDSDAKAGCNSCGWCGERHQLVEETIPSQGTPAATQSNGGAQP